MFNSLNFTVFVQNRCQKEDFYPDSIAKMQDTLHSCLQKSKLKYSGKEVLYAEIMIYILKEIYSIDFLKKNFFVGSVKCNTNSSFQKEWHQKVNLFLLPEKEQPDIGMHIFVI